MSNVRVAVERRRVAVSFARRVAVQARREARRRGVVRR